MKGFAGFPVGKQPNVPVPELFFTELLPDLDHLAELKLTLHIFWRLARSSGKRGADRASATRSWSPTIACSTVWPRQDCHPKRPCAMPWSGPWPEGRSCG